MKTENLTHGSYKAVREVFCNISCFHKEGKGFILCESENSANFHFVHVIFAENGSVKNKAAAIIHRLSHAAVVAETSIYLLIVFISL